MFIATVVAAERLTEFSLRAALAEAAAAVESIEAVEPERVLRARFAGDPIRVRATLEQMPADVFVRAADAPAPKLLVADMDSTMITVECIDELADYAGVKPEVATITERAMRGELDFEGALRQRVALLKGLPEDVLDRCYRERVQIMPGARALVRTLNGRGCRTVLVSGGFTHFADRVAAEIGFDAARANVLGIRNGRLDGTVVEPILSAAAKRAALEELGADLEPMSRIAIGDGANDVPMIEGAGFGIAYHAKWALTRVADASVRFGDLTAVLHGLGVPRRDWIT